MAAEVEARKNNMLARVMLYMTLQVGALTGSPLGMSDVTISVKAGASSRCACTCGFKNGKYYDAFGYVFHPDDGFVTKHYS